MPTIADIAIVIRTWDYSETSQTVCMFTREHGMLRGLAKGAKRERGRFSSGFDLLTLGQVVAIVKRTTDLATITDWDLQEICWAARSDLRAYRTGMYISDIVYHLVTDHDPHAQLFDAMRRALRALGGRELLNLELLRFQLALLREVGYQPELHEDTETRVPIPPGAEVLAFRPEAGGIGVDEGNASPGRWRVRIETVELLRSITRNADEPTQHADIQSVERANRLLAAYIRYLIGEEPRTMSMLFPELGV